jgi:glycine cleavage system regulatory protein
MVEFTHANNGKKILLNPLTCHLVYESDSKSTHITSNAGILSPVKESVETVRREIEKALSGEEK